MFFFFFFFFFFFPTLTDSVKMFGTRHNMTGRERGGVVVKRRTPTREVLGSIPAGVTVLCP